MTAPSPAAFAVIAEQAKDLLTHDPTRCGQTNPDTGQPLPLCLVCTYRWAFSAGHDRAVTDEAKVHSAGASPTESIVFSRYRVRDACKRANEAVKAVAALEGLLLSSLEGSDPKHHAETRYASGTRIVTNDDLDKARDAKKRREGRGEGFGDS